eukprot:1168240-Pyramimonas_sp.AAC.1
MSWTDCSGQPAWPHAGPPGGEAARAGRSAIQQAAPPRPRGNSSGSLRTGLRNRAGRGSSAACRAR